MFQMTVRVDHRSDALFGLKIYFFMQIMFDKQLNSFSSLHKLEKVYNS